MAHSSILKQQMAQPGVLQPAVQLPAEKLLKHLLEDLPLLSVFQWEFPVPGMAVLQAQLEQLPALVFG